MTLRDLPGVDKVLSDKRICELAAKYPHEFLVGVIRQQLENERNAINAGKKDGSVDGIIRAVEERVAAIFAPSLRRVINASGVILHTNLGRAPISAFGSCFHRTIACARTVGGSRGVTTFWVIPKPRT